VKASNGRDHVVEQPAPRVAGVSDKGIVHPRNEDAAALAADPDTGWAALVVCDGVTTATDSDVASLAAVKCGPRAARCGTAATEHVS
jgi:serine/threonine protein phosphatase PrpC